MPSASFSAFPIIPSAFLSASEILSEILESPPLSPLTLFSNSTFVFSKSDISFFSVLYFSSNDLAYSLSNISFDFSNWVSCSLRLFSISFFKSSSKSLLYSARSSSPAFDACLAFSKRAASSSLIGIAEDLFLPLFFPLLFLLAIWFPS